VNNGIVFRISVWYTIDFYENVNLGVGSIIMPFVSFNWILVYVIIFFVFVFNKCTL